MNWFTDKLYDLGASPRAGEAAWGELAAQDAMPPRVRASYYEGLEMPKDPRAAGWRSAPRMGNTVALPGTADWMLPPEGLVRVGTPSQEVARRFGASGLTPPPARSAEDAYRMGGLAATDQYKPNTFRELDREAIEEQYGGADIHGIKLPPVSKGEPRAWFDTFVGETPADAALNWGLGGTGRAAKAALALGGLFKATDPAEAGVIGKVGKVLAGKTGGPHPGGIHVYHSSPHDFDKFDWSKLRTGEGANTYGAGFYFAENPKVSGQGGEYWNQFSRRFGDNPEGTAASYLALEKFDRQAAAARVRDQVQRNREWQKTAYLPDDERVAAVARNAQLEESLKLLESGAPVGPRTYEVNIAARPELMLDWDKPVEQQAAVLKQLEPVLTGSSFRDAQRMTGNDFYQSLRQDFTGDKGVRASETLREAGIPGIRYLDQGSRGIAKQADELLKIYQTPERVREVAQQAVKSGSGDSDYWQAVLRGLGERTYNYVVTDPSKLDILAKYGIVGTAGGMGALAAQDRYQQ